MELANGCRLPDSSVKENLKGARIACQATGASCPTIVMIIRASGEERGGAESPWRDRPSSRLVVAAANV